MVCDSCGNRAATRISYSKGKEACDKCGDIGSFKFSDVFFKSSYFDPNLSDPVKSPFGTHITSREQKARVMKECGLKESGDRKHGSRARF